MEDLRRAFALSQFIALVQKELQFANPLRLTTLGSVLREVWPNWKKELGVRGLEEAVELLPPEFLLVRQSPSTSLLTYRPNPYVVAPHVTLQPAFPPAATKPATNPLLSAQKAASSAISPQDRLVLEACQVVANSVDSHLATPELVSHLNSVWPNWPVHFGHDLKAKLPTLLDKFFLPDLITSSQTGEFVLQRTFRTTVLNAAIAVTSGSAQKSATIREIIEMLAVQGCGPTTPKTVHKLLKGVPQSILARSGEKVVLRAPPKLVRISKQTLTSSSSSSPNVKIVDNVADGRRAAQAILGGGRKVVVVDCEGVRLGANGHLCLVQIAASEDHVVLFDVHEEPALLETHNGLREILEDPAVVKVMHDCREDSAALFVQHNVQLRNVFDTQLAYEVLRYYDDSTKNDIHSNINNNDDDPMTPLSPIRNPLVSMMEVLRAYGDERALSAVQKRKDSFKAAMAKEPNLWTKRPLTRDMIEYATGDVIHLGRACARMRDLLDLVPNSVMAELRQECDKRTVVVHSCSSSSSSSSSSPNGRSAPPQRQQGATSDDKAEETKHGGKEEGAVAQSDGEAKWLAFGKSHEPLYSATLVGAQQRMVNRHSYREYYRGRRREESEDEGYADGGWYNIVDSDEEEFTRESEEEDTKSSLEGLNAAELETLLEILPEDVAAHITEDLIDKVSGMKLVDIRLDVGKTPRFRLLEVEPLRVENSRRRHMPCEMPARLVVREDLDRVIARIPPFDPRNRSGVPNTLHRVSAIRNRSDQVIGLTIRVGRSNPGIERLFDDVLHADDKSVLLVGPPGVGKTTLLREFARKLSYYDKRNNSVIIVDTSNEIGGEGDVPHASIGDARRMQVNDPKRQHAVLVEAVQNHSPDVVIVDEVGTQQEARAVQSITQRGVRVIATVHGCSLADIVRSPDLSLLVGGKQSVILSDAEANRRGSPKVVQERTRDPCFAVAIELHSPAHFLIHHNVKEAVDKILAERPVPVERRWIALPAHAVNADDEDDESCDEEDEDFSPRDGGLPHARSSSAPLFKSVRECVTYTL